MLENRLIFPNLTDGGTLEKRSRQSIAIGALFFLPALVSAGCNDKEGKRLGEKKRTAKANEFCMDYQEQGDAVAADAFNVESGADISDSFNDVASLAEGLLAKLRKLNPPRTEEAASRKIVSEGEKYVELVGKPSAAFGSANGSLPTVLLSKIDSTGRRLDTLSRRLGANECAG